MSKRRRDKSTRRNQTGGKVRPTTQKVLESLAAILEPELEGAQVLDLFAGTGRVGFELLSRGAASLVFVEGHRRVAGELRSLVRDHPDRDNISVILGAVPKVLGKVRGQFDVVVCDPPYDWTDNSSLLPAANQLTKSGGVLVVEHHHKVLYEATEGWLAKRQEKFGETRLTFFQKQ